MNWLARRDAASAGTVDVIVIGAGHSGLAMSRSLAEAGVDHVVLERGEIANAWRYERWDSLRLLTPNWQCRLPGYRYTGPDPDGYMTMPEVVTFIEGYARVLSAPVRTGTTVTSVTHDADRFRVATNHGTWKARAVVLANGASSVPVLPACAADLPASVRSVTTKDYRNPDRLQDGGVLVVGASATGLQLADEIQRSGRKVTLAVGEHIRLPRVYRSLDIQWWLDALGILDQRFDQVDDLVRARRIPSPQLIGTPERSTLDLNTLTARGVEIVGRLVAIRDGEAYFSGSLSNHCAMADLKLTRLLDRIDTWAAETGVASVIPPATRFDPTRVPRAPRLKLQLARERIHTVIWATGLAPDYSWLHVPAFDARQRLKHDGGIVTAVPGLCAMGLPFMRRRKSSFIHGAEDDARELCEHLVAHLRRTTSRTFALREAG